ncbi:MAG: DUF3696 domain-containing protein [Anaerolineae bacterium]|nr:DUF3696 domain-containing protein [Anaerolineae bacterium]
MLLALRLVNFKSIKESPQIEFGKLNILSGTNSSGKSTLIQSILLSAQTLLSDNHDQALVLNGPLVSLGTPSDLWYNGQLSEPLGIRFTLRAAGQGVDVLYDLTFEAAQESETPTIQLQEGYYATSPLDAADYSGIRYIRKQLPELDPEFEAQIRAALGGATVHDDDPLKMRSFLPSAFMIFTERVDADLWEKRFLNPFGYGKDSGEEIPQTYADNIARISAELKLRRFPNRVRPRVFALPELPKFGEYIQWAKQLTTGDFNRFTLAIHEDFEKRKKEEGAVRLMSIRQDFKPEALAIFERAAESFLTMNLRYLSANRVGPTALFEVSRADAISEVGTYGQNLALALRQYGRTQLTYWSPTRQDDTNATLQEAVADWLQYMGLIQRYELVDYGKLGVFLQIFVKGVSKPLDLTSVGFGTSQVLPILVQGLLTPEGGLFIVEQPEVHLHPKLQSSLAYFFYSLSRRNVQCIVETHSDHIVNQLRVLVAKMPQLRQHIRIYFASRSPEEGTTFEEVRLGKTGAIKNWPQDFLSEADKLARELVKTALAQQ